MFLLESSKVPHDSTNSAVIGESFGVDRDSCDTGLGIGSNGRRLW